MLFQPSISFSQKTVLLSYAPIQIKDGQTQLTTISTTDHPYTLSPNTCLSTVSPSLPTCTITPLPLSTFIAHQSHMIPHRRSNSSRPCYVYRRTLSKNNVYHRLHAQWYPSELRH